MLLLHVETTLIGYLNIAHQADQVKILNNEKNIIIFDNAIIVEFRRLLDERKY